MVDAGGTGVTSDQFTRNALRWLSPADFPAAAWVEAVPDSRRSAYERRIGQPIVTPDERHSVVPAGSRSSYLAATLVSGFPPLALPGIDLSGEPGMATALDRATHLDRVTATPAAGPDTGTNGLFLIAPAPNLVEESLRPGYVVVFVPDLTLSAAADTPGLRLARGGARDQRGAASEGAERARPHLQSLVRSDRGGQLREALHARESGGGADPRLHTGRAARAAVPRLRAPGRPRADSGGGR